MRIGVCHVEKVLKPAPSSSSLEEALNKNQATYQPQRIFSAGFCQIRESLDDGRILVEIEMDGRYELGTRRQEIPYQIYDCSAYEDIESNSDLAKAHRSEIDNFLKKLALKQEDQQLLKFIDSANWQSLSTYQYSFKIFELLKFDGEIAQEILEQQKPELRLGLACRLLNINPSPSMIH